MRDPLALDIKKLAEDIARIGDGKVPWALGKIANERIKQAQERAPQSPVLAQIDLFAPTSDRRAVDHLSANAVAAILQEVAREIPRLPPALPKAAPRDSIMGDIANMKW